MRDLSGRRGSGEKLWAAAPVPRGRPAPQLRRYAARNCRYLSMKVREVIRVLEKDGWRHVRTKGSHRQFQHSVKSETVTVAGQLGVDVPPGTLNSILKQSGLKRS
jgi:predicted RNA binding protein YcfA (HicA-like mRNA interferase family)